MNTEKYVKYCYELAKMIGSVLEDEGMRVFEYWGGEIRPLEELIAEMDEIKKGKS